MEKSHTDRAYEKQLQDLRDALIQMGGQVEDMIVRSVEALVNSNVEVARRTIEEDRRINRAELEMDELCMVILAKRQPLASDLRFVTLVLKMVTDLERIGDLAVNICERAIDLAALPPLKPWKDVPEMSELVRSMVHDAIGAFMARDVDLAQKVIDRDTEVDALYTRVFRELLAIMAKDASTVERGIHVQSVAKWLERMADHSTNLAEQVIFMVKGKDVRHQGSRA